MTDITRIYAIVNGINKGIDLSDKSLVMQSLKLSTSELTKTILDKLIEIQGLKGLDYVAEGDTNLYFTGDRARAAAVADQIVSGVTDVAPSQNAVYYALADKDSIITVSDTTTIDLTRTTNDITADIKATSISNSHIATDAAIVYSKLSIANGDLTIAKTSGLQTALDGKVDENSAITGATKTKITYDAKGLVTSGADATTDDIQESGTPTNKYFTDARAKAAAVADSITDGVTDVAPSQNAVFDALALKAADNAVVHLTGDESVGGVKTFTSFPVSPSSAPTTDYQVANKKYVDDQLTSTSFITSITDTNSIDLDVTTKVLTANLRLDGSTLAIGTSGVKVNSIANAQVASDAAIALSKLATVTASRALVSDASGYVSASSVTATELGYVSGVSSAIQTQINNLSSLIQNFEWKNSVKDRLATPPGSPATGDRYLVIATASGAWEGQENKIAEWDGDSWEFTTCTLGTFVAIDDENDGLYLFSGSAWDKKYFEATTASVGLEKVGFDIRIANAVAANGISITSGAISAVYDNSSIGINGSAQLYVKASGITNDMLAGSIVYSKLSIADADLTIAKTSGLQTALDGKVDENSAITGATKTKITYDAKGLVTAGADAAIADITGLETALSGKEPTISAGTTSQYWRGDKSWQTLDKSAVGLGNVDNVQQLPISYLDTDGTLAANSDTKVASQKATKTYVDNKVGAANAIYVTLTNNTGSAIAAGSIVALSQSVAGEIFLADSDAISTCESVVGVVQAEIANEASGQVQIGGEATVVNGGTSFDLGKRVYVSGTAGRGTKTAPTTENSVVFVIGVASATNKVILQQNLVGIN